MELTYEELEQLDDQVQGRSLKIKIRAEMSKLRAKEHKALQTITPDELDDIIEGLRLLGYRHNLLDRMTRLRRRHSTTKEFGIVKFK